MSSLRGSASPNIYMLIPNMFPLAAELIQTFASGPTGPHHPHDSIAWCRQTQTCQTDGIYISPIQIGHLDSFFYDVSGQGFCQFLNWIVFYVLRNLQFSVYPIHKTLWMMHAVDILSTLNLSFYCLIAAFWPIEVLNFKKVDYISLLGLVLFVSA